MHEAQRQRLRLLPALLLAGAMAAWAAYEGSALFRSDLLATPARNKVEAWAQAGQGWTVDEWKQTRAALKSALQITPGDPVLHFTLAQLYVTQGLVAWADFEQREAFFLEALMHQEEALRLRPVDGRTWSQVAISLFALRRPMPELQHAWLQARRFAPYEAPVQRALMDLAVATWNDATPEMQAWVQQTWRDGTSEAKEVYLKDARRRGRDSVLH